MNGLKIGLKILAAVIAGAAIIVGIEKSIGSSNNQKPNNPVPPRNPGNNGGDSFLSSGKPCSDGNGVAPQQAPQQPTKTEVILSGVRGAGETCGKLYMVAQSISQLIESVTGVFGNNRTPMQQMPGSGGYYQPQQYQPGGNIVWVPAAGSNCVYQAVQRW